MSTLFDDIVANNASINAGSVSDQKKANIGKAAADKKKALAGWDEAFLGRMDDADSGTMQGMTGEELRWRLGTPPEERRSVDAAEVDHGSGSYERNLDYQKIAYSNKYGVPPESVTNQMIYEEGARKQADAEGPGGFFRQGQNTFDPTVDAGQTEDDFPPVVAYQRTGEISKDAGKRPITEMANPFSEELYEPTLNNPEDNAYWEAPWNEGARAEAAQQQAVAAQNPAASMFDQVVANRANMALRKEVAPQQVTDPYAPTSGDFVDDVPAILKKGGKQIGLMAWMGADYGSRALKKPLELLTGMDINSLEEMTGVGGRLHANIQEGTKEYSAETQQAMANISARSQKIEKEQAKIIAKKKLDGTYNPVIDEPLRFFEEFTSGVKAYWDNPRAAGEGAIASAPQFLIGGGVGKLASSLALRQATKGLSAAATKDFIKSKTGKELITKMATRANIGYVGLSEGLTNGSESRAQVMGMEHDDLMAQSTQYKKLIDAGIPEEKAKSEVAYAAQDFTTIMSGLGGAAISKLTGVGKWQGNLFNKNTPMEKMLKQGAQGNLRRGATKVAGGTLRETPEELGQEGLGQLAQNIAEKLTVNADKDVGEGVGTGAAAGAVVGGLTGASVGGVAATPDALGVVGDTVSKLTPKKARTAIAGKAKSVADATVKGMDRARIAKARRSGELDDIYDTESESYDPEVAFGTALNEFSSLNEPVEPKSDQPAEQAEYDQKNSEWGDARVAALGQMKKHAEQLADNFRDVKAEFEADPTSHTKEEVEDLRVFAMRAVSQVRSISEESQARIQKVNADTLASIVQGATPLTPENTTEVVGSLNTFGSEELDQLVEQAKKTPDIDPHLMQSLEDSAKASRAEEDYINTRVESQDAKSSNEVKNEVFFTGKAKPGGGRYLGLAQHKEAINSALAAKEPEKALAALSELVKFANTHNRRAGHYADALAETMRKRNEGLKGEAASTKVQGGSDFTIRGSNQDAGRRIKNNIIAEGEILRKVIKKYDSDLKTVYPELDFKRGMDSLDARYTELKARNTIEKAEKFDARTAAEKVESEKLVFAAPDTQAPPQNQGKQQQQSTQKGPPDLGTTRTSQAGPTNTVSEGEVAVVKQRAKNLNDSNTLDAKQTATLSGYRNRLADTRNPPTKRVVNNILRGITNLEQAAKPKATVKTEPAAVPPKAAEAATEGKELSKSAVDKAKTGKKPYITQAKVEVGGQEVLAKQTPTGIVIKEKISIGEFFDYINGETLSATSKQKKVVSAELAKLGYTDVVLRNALNTEEKIKEFLYQHEKSHIDNNDRHVYYNESKTDFLTPDKIAIEVRASIDALKVLNISPEIVEAKNLDFAVPEDTESLSVTPAESIESTENSTVKAYIPESVSPVDEGSINAEPKEVLSHSSHDLDLIIKSGSEGAGLFSKYGNLFSLLKDPEGAKQIQKDHKISDDDMALLQDLISSETPNSFMSLFYKAFDSVLPNTYEVFPQHLEASPYLRFRNVDGTYPENVANAIAMVGLNWVITRAQETLNNEEYTVNAILHQNPEDTVTQAAMRALRDKGPLSRILAQDMGREILRQLSLQEVTVEGADGLNIYKMEMSLGKVALDILEEMNLVQYEAIDQEQLHLLKSDSDNIPEPTNKKSLSNLVHLASVEGKAGFSEPSPFSAAVIKKTEEYKPILQKLFEIDKYGQDPNDEPSDFLDKRLGRTGIQETTEGSNEARLIMQAVPYIPVAKLHDVFNKLTPENQELLGGFKDPADGSIANSDSTQATNDGIKRDLKNINEYMNGRPLDKEFFYNYFNAGQGRFHVTQTDLSYQTSKIVRHIFGQKAFYKEYALDADSTKIGIMEGFGLGADKNLPENILGEGLSKEDKILNWHNIINEETGEILNSEMAAAIAAIRKEGSLTPAEQTAIVDASAKENYHSFASLLALSEYSLAAAKGDKNVLMHMPREADGTTDGPGSLATQIGPDDLELRKNLMRAVGFKFEGDGQDSFVEWLNVPGNYDNYQALARAFNQALNRMKNVYSSNASKAAFQEKGQPTKYHSPAYTQSLAKAATAIDRVLTQLVERQGEIFEATKAGRDTAKPALMPFAYGAGLPAVINSLNNSTLGQLYDEFIKSKSQEEVNEMVASINDILAVDFTNVNANKIRGKIDLVNVKNAKLSARQAASIQTAMGRYFKIPMNEALEEVLGNTSAHKNTLVGAANVMSHIWVTRYNKEVAKLEAEELKAYNENIDSRNKKNGTELPHKKSVYLTRAKIKEVQIKLRDAGWLPTIRFHHSSKENFKDSYPVTKIKRDILLDAEGKPAEEGKVKTMASAHRISYPKVRRFDANDKTISEEETRSMQLAVSVPQFDDNVGVAPVTSTVIAMDSSIQTDMMTSWMTDNLFDAFIGAADMIEEISQDGSRRFLDLHDEYSLPVEFNTTLIRMMENYNSKELTDAERETINKGVRGDKDTFADGHSVTMSAYVSNLTDKLLELDASRQTVVDTVIGVDHYAAGNSMYLVPGKKQPTQEEAAKLNADLRNRTMSTQIPAAEWDETTDAVTVPGVTKVTFKVQAHFIDPANKQNTLYSVTAGDGKKEVWFVPTINKHDTKQQAVTYFNTMLMDRYISKGVSVEEFEDQVVKNLEEDHPVSAKYGSEEGTPGAINQYFTPRGRKTVDANTAIEVFQDLIKSERKPENEEHMSFLKEILTSSIIPMLRDMDSLTLFEGQSSIHSFGLYEPGTGLYVAAGKGLIDFGMEMSPQEIYVHELLHAAFDHALKNNSKFYTEAKRLFDLAQKSVKPEDLLHKNADGSTNIPVGSTLETEMAHARKRYDYIFDNKKDVLHEFLAFGLSNESFNNALGGTPNKNAPIDYEGGFSLVREIEKLLSKVIAWISDSITHSKEPDVASALKALSRSVQQVQNENLGKIDQLYTKAYGYNKPATEALKNYIWKPYTHHVARQKKVDKKKLPGYLDQIIAIPNDLWNSEYRKHLSEIMYDLDWTMDNTVYSLLDEIRGVTTVNLPFHNLLREVKHYGDGVKEEEYKGMARQTEKYFDKTPSRKEWEHIAAGALKTELSGLLDKLPMNSITNILRDNKALNAEISNLRIRLNRLSPSHTDYYKIQTESLGHFMARGTVGISRQMLNAHNIASLMATGKTPTGNIDKAVDLIEQLATLYAIKYTDQESKQVTADFMEHEYAVNKSLNGMSFLLNAQKNFKEQSLNRLFNGDPTQMIKGYTHEMYDEYRNVRVAPKSKEEDMRLEGYHIQDAIPRDSQSKLTEPMYVYVSKDGLQNRYVTTLFSLQDQTGKGTTVHDILMQRPGINPAMAYRAANSEVARQNSETHASLASQFDGSAKLNFNNNWMLPTMTEDGIITNYRYTMSEANKKRYLNKRDEAHKVIGRMNASLYEKPYTIGRNKKVLQYLYLDYKRGYNNKPNQYIEIGPDVENDEHRNYWKMLPKDAKKELKRLWKGDTMYIRGDLVKMVFGFRKLSFTNWANKTAGAMPPGISHTFRLSGQIWQGVISVGKRAVIILIPDVVIMNTASNYHLLLWKGVPPEFAIKTMGNAVNNTNRYRKDRVKKLDLERLMENVPGANNIKNKKKLRELNESMERNPIKKYFDAGMFQNIVEDVDLQEQGGEDVLNRVLELLPGDANLTEEKFSEQLERLPDAVKVAWKNLVIHPDTDLSKLLTVTTQYSDFIARVALIEHQTRHEGIAFDPAIQDAMKTFINYDVPTSPAMQWVNDMGIMMYTKFAIRILRILFNTALDAPLTGVQLELAQEFAKGILGSSANLDTIVDSNILTNTWRLELPGSLGRFDDAFGAHIFNFLPGAINPFSD